MVTALLITIGVLGLIQPCTSRKLAVLLYSSIGLSFVAIDQYLSSEQYFFVAAICDLLFIILASGISPASRLVVWLSCLSLAGIAVNLYGWLLWRYGVSLDSYVGAFTVIYVLAIVSTISGAHKDGHCDKRNAWGDYISFDSRSWFGRVMENLHKAKS